MNNSINEDLRGQSNDNFLVTFVSYIHLLESTINVINRPMFLLSSLSMLPFFLSFSLKPHSPLYKTQLISVET